MKLFGVVLLLVTTGCRQQAVAPRAADAGVPGSAAAPVVTWKKTTAGRLLREELLTMAWDDQAARNAEGAGTDPALIDRMVTMDAKNTARMRQIVADVGWPGKSLVSDEGAKAAWLLVQHADRDRPFQRLCLKKLEVAVKAGEADASDLAYLVDRLAVAENRKQTYGTQFFGATPAPIEDEQHVDERRKAVGLPSMEEYRRQLMQAYGGKDKIQ